MVMRTTIDADKKYGNVSPRKAEEIELELVHVSGFAIEQQEEAQHRRLGPRLPAEDGVMYCRLRMLLKVHLLDLLPACHDAGAAAEVDGAPHLVQVLVVDAPDVLRLVGERDEVEAAELVVMVLHGFGKAAYDGLGDGCE